MSTTTINTTVPEKQLEYKVFVGNLSFKTSKDTLTSFAESSGRVLETTIITRGTRSLGYGFITFETEKEAQKASQDLNKQSLDGREINVEVARPKAEGEVRKTRKAKNASRKKSKNDSDDAIVELKKEEPVKKSKKTREVITPSTTSESEGETTASRRKRNKKNKKRQNKKTEKAARITEPSKTTLFVANLPYATTDDDLNKIFSAYKLVSAHVARMKNGRSKGYGFVEFEEEADQLKALESVKDVILEGRAIYLKIALSEQKALAAGELKEETKPVVTRDVKEEVKVAEVKKDTKAVEVKKEEPVSKKEVPAVAAKKEVPAVAAKKEAPVVAAKVEPAVAAKVVPAVVATKVEPAVAAKVVPAVVATKVEPAVAAKVVPAVVAAKVEPVVAAKAVPAKVEPVVPAAANKVPAPTVVKIEPVISTEVKVESLQVNDIKK